MKSTPMILSATEAARQHLEHHAHAVIETVELMAHEFRLEGRIGAGEGTVGDPPGRPRQRLVVYAQFSPGAGVVVEVQVQFGAGRCTRTAHGDFYADTTIEALTAALKGHGA